MVIWWLKLGLSQTLLHSMFCAILGRLKQLQFGTARAPQTSFSVSVYSFHVVSPHDGLRVAGFLTWWLKDLRVSMPIENSRNLLSEVTSAALCSLRQS